MTCFAQHRPLIGRAKTGFEARPHHRVRLPSLSGVAVRKEAATSLPQPGLDRQGAVLADFAFVTEAAG